MGFGRRNYGNLNAFRDIRHAQSCRELGLLRSTFERWSLSATSWMKLALRWLGLGVSRWVLLAKKQKDWVKLQVI